MMEEDRSSEEDLAGPCQERYE